MNKQLGSHQSIQDIIMATTGGRPYVFMIMAYEDIVSRRPLRETVYSEIKNISQNEFDVLCIRADEITGSGQELLPKLHALIEGADLVLAEISEMRPNVFYEVGYAMGAGKDVLPLIETGCALPYNLQGLETLQYDNTFDGLNAFKAKVRQHFKYLMRRDLPRLREMLAPTNPEGSYIVASPKYPGVHSRIKGQVYDRRTFGDHLGILGIITAFGQLYGETKCVELISAQHSAPDLLTGNGNFFLIGSHKVNPYTGEILATLQARQERRFVFGVDESSGWTGGETKEDDWPVCLYEETAGQRRAIPGKRERVGRPAEDVWIEDYGIIVRGPHPRHPARMIMVIAGAHSLGSGAACLAVTRSNVISKVREKLPPGILTDKSRSFWALIKGVASAKDHLLDDDGVTVVEAGELR